jgi:hypothetical protein
VDIRTLVKVAAVTAAEVCACFDLKPEARLLLRDGMGPKEFVAVLVANKQYIAAIDFITHALPAREAVWWGCLCLQYGSGGILSPLDKAACKAAVQWVVQPTEENRAAAQAPAREAGLVTPAGQLAMAANQTGGNIAPPNTPSMAPGPFAPANAVAIAVKMATSKAEPVKIVDTQRLFVELGIGVAEGRFP